MIDGIVIRGTTPIHEFEIPYPIEIVKNIRITYAQNKKVCFTKVKSDCVLTEGKAEVSLTQEETYSFEPTKPIMIELRIQLTNDKVLRSEEPITLRVVDSFDNEVMV